MAATKTGKTGTRKIEVPALARVEGEGGLYVKMTNGKVSDVRVNIYEPPRFFEAFLQGRNFTEPVDITARICGICPVAYQTSSARAMEAVCKVDIPAPIRALRRLLYLGEYIESHALHVYLLHVPDFLGYESAIHVAADHPDVVKKALKLKKIGNDIMVALGGREIHPINMRVGGFYKVPSKKDLKPLVENLKWALEASLETVKFVSKLPFPDFEQDYEFVSLRHPDEYPLFDGRVVSSKGLDIAIKDYEKHFVENHERRSNALHSKLDGRNYFVGPMARYALNFDKLPKVAQQAAKEAGIGPVVRNPFQSVIVRSVETVWACDEALKIIADYEMPDRPSVDVQPKAGVGCGASEAPRGILYHRYTIDSKGVIKNAKITPPTAQNLPTIENDLRQFITANISLPDDKLTWQCEQAIRNYDPCISCATHFLKMEIDRS